MRCKYQMVLFSFCRDMTDPFAPSVPVAALAIGVAGSKRAAATVTLDIPGLAIDEFSQAILHQLQAILREQVDRIFKSMPTTAPLVTALRFVHDTLRNNLHVSKLSEEFEAEIDPDGDTASELRKVVLYAADEWLRHEFSEQARSALPALGITGVEIMGLRPEVPRRDLGHGTRKQVTVEPPVSSATWDAPPMRAAAGG
jgi:hypothetical protein